ncbi:MAG TPA: hypothetical protein PKE06_19045, partial [Flavilitoribacter sp.]|nr:hypothetical protein [Flavilitoribacter sp.]
MASDHHVLGIDVGGSGIKGGIIDVQSGQMLTDRLRLETPKPATPAAMDIGAKEIDRWHRAKGWFTIGYHFAIRRDGSIEYGRELSEVGA